MKRDFGRIRSRLAYVRVRHFGSQLLYFRQQNWSKIEQFDQVSALRETNNLYEKGGIFRVFAKIAPKTLKKPKTGTYIAQGFVEIQGIELSAKNVRTMRGWDLK